MRVAYNTLPAIPCLRPFRNACMTIHMATVPDDLRIYAPRRFNPVTKQRFKRDRRRRLIAHVGGKPSEIQKIRIECIIGLEWDITRLSAKMDAGELSEHATRQLLACHNHLRMQLAALGPAAAAKALSLAEVLAQDSRRAPQKAASAQIPSSGDVAA